MINYAYYLGEGKALSKQIHHASERQIKNHGKPKQIIAIERLGKFNYKILYKGG
jgi:hypothetical protein